MRKHQIRCKISGRMAMHWCLVCILCLIKVCQAQVFYVCAPSTLRINSDEAIAVVLENGPTTIAKVLIQDHPGRIKNISEVELQLKPSEPEIVNFKLDPNKFPPNFFKGKDTKSVVLSVHAGNFRKELIISLTKQSGYAFVQTDKPIYTPKELVQFRIILLGEDGLHSSDEVSQLQIKNPDNIIVDEKTFSKNKWPFLNPRYQFPKFSVLGDWSATVRYGHLMEQNATVHFALQKYVLPTFTVELKTQEIILPSDSFIAASVTAKYVYGKDVNGYVSFRLGMKGESRDVHYFASLSSKPLEKGKYDLQIDTSELKNHVKVGWFPEIAGSRLVVEANVVDDASGLKESTIDTNARFVLSPYTISFDKSLQDFKPGLKTTFEIAVKFVSGHPAPRVPLTIRAEADGKVVQVSENAVTDNDGKFSAQIQPEMDSTKVTVTVKTADPRYGDNQAEASHSQEKFRSRKNAYIALERSGARTYKVGDTFNSIVHMEPAGIDNVYYVVKSRNHIFETGKLRSGRYKVLHLEFQVTSDMTPSFRVLIFAHHQEELLADSLKIEVDKQCHPNARVNVEAEFVSNEPGNKGKIKVTGTKSTVVGLLAVDEAVYSISKRDVLTKDKMFKAFIDHDLGCGTGGGLNTDTVLANVGVLMSTNFYNPPLKSVSSCVEVKRRKREIAAEKLKVYTGRERKCCALGMSDDPYKRTCEERSKIVLRYFKQCEEYANTVMHCCEHANETGFDGMKVADFDFFHRGRSGGDEQIEIDFIDAKDEAAIEKGTVTRKNFQESWAFDSIPINPDGEGVLDASLPHSITTWVLSAVSINPKHGICVLDPPIKILAFKKLFLQLHLPYSVVRNEQVEIRATLFNYATSKIKAVVFMYGVQDLCTGTEEGEKSERKRVEVPPNGAVSVAFPVVPLKEGTFPIKVLALTSGESDSIEKELLVVPEGVTQEIDIPIILDPSNQQRRKERRVQSEFVSDYIHPTEKLQVTKVDLTLPNDFVPGTESCTIVALGDQMGSTVETALTDPESLIRKPHGCGEQNMMFLAPTLYTMRYLKVAGKMKPENEEKGYEFIRQGYGNQLSFRKQDGSYAAYQHKPTSTWLTAFVMKVFCQASELVFIDENVLCGGIQWLIDNQQPDGSYLEVHPMYHVDMMGGVHGKIPMTAFTLIALEECTTCEQNKLVLVKQRALSFIEEHVHEVVDPLPVALLAYALTLSNSRLKDAMNSNLLSLAQYDESTNTLHWETLDSARDVETAGYALLNQLRLNEMNKAMSIVNWLNMQRLSSGSFKSTQDTVVALQALSEYAIRANSPPLSLVANITSSNDRHFSEVLEFNDGNAQVLQIRKLKKVDGTIFVKTSGEGIGSMSVKLRYNLRHSPEKLCKFLLNVNVTSPEKESDPVQPDIDDFDVEPKSINFFQRHPPDLIRGLKEAINASADVPVLVENPRNRDRAARVRREDNIENSQVRLKITICAKYLGNSEAGMSIIDAGLFTGFETEEKDLEELKNEPDAMILSYEKSKRSVIFYLKKVPIDETYCFHFHVVQKFIVGKPQSTAVKIYDYYHPDESCTNFYSPGRSSPMLRKLCDHGICQCAEGGCPSSTPFAFVSGLEKREMREKLKAVACNKYDFVWRGKNEGDVSDGAFRNISFRIEEVYKEGTEKRSMLEGSVREFLAKDVCSTTALLKDDEYLIMGKDGQKYLNERKEIWHRYFLGNNTAIHLWKPIRVSSNKELQKSLNYVTRALKETGCDD